MKYTRTPTITTAPVSLAILKAYMRIDANDEDALIESLGATAAGEIEAYADLALLGQTISATTDDLDQIIALPVGPVKDGATVTVSAIGKDGTTTPVTGFWLEVGRYPRLHLTTAPTTPLRVTYAAGYGTAADVPADLKMATCDQAVRLYGQRGDEDVKQGLSSAAARIAARYRRVAL